MKLKMLFLFAVIPLFTTAAEARESEFEMQVIEETMLGEPTLEASCAQLAVSEAELEEYLEALVEKRRIAMKQHHEDERARLSGAISTYRSELKALKSEISRRCRQ